MGFSFSNFKTSSEYVERIREGDTKVPASEVSRVMSLRYRWDAYDRAYRGLPDYDGNPYPYLSSRETVLAAYTDWLDAVEADHKEQNNGK